MHTPFQRNLTELIFRISRLLGAEEPPRALLDQVVDEVAERLGAARVEIRIESSPGRPIVAERAAAHGPSYVVYTSPLAVNGTSFGSFTVEIAQSVEEPARVLRALESVAWMLTATAERIALRDHHVTLRRQLDEAQRLLVRHKVLVRAAGIVAARLSIGQPEAVAWIEAEAARLNRNVEAIAERIIEISAESAQAQVA